MIHQFHNQYKLIIYMIKYTGVYILGLIKKILQNNYKNSKLR